MNATKDDIKELKNFFTNRDKNRERVDAELLERVKNIENRVYSMNDKIASNGKDIYWIKRIGVFMVTVLAGLWSSLFFNK
ncbi:MAG: hypothetical protein OXC92_09835 [Flavobacteriaceae bacterium]|nr:hypothetical protein [Flavobacteriaceae bacterium]